MSVEGLQSVRQDLNEFITQFEGTFTRIEPVSLCQLYLQGFLNDMERKNVEAIALELEGPEVVRNLQRFFTDYEWDEKSGRETNWKLCAENLAKALGVWSIDASEFPKKSKHSVGVAPQHCGALGKTANCHGALNWKAVSVADFNNDGTSDILLQKPNGDLAIWYMNDLSLSSVAFVNPKNPGPGCQAVGVGDFNGDGNQDILFQFTDGSLAV